ncbi:hypothetical protein ACFV2S_06015 [Streptomyces sp. NPDC059695]|uniref:hypothetical protein n=1 Tax=Streptomyces sp. NPDC059695 TaxID=3346910 RepID=UPI0036878557
MERLDRTAAAVEAADHGDAEQTRIRQEAVWQGWFEDLLESVDGQERDAMVAALRTLVTEPSPSGRTGGGEMSGNTFQGPTAIQLGNGNRQDNRFGNGT